MIYMKTSFSENNMRQLTIGLRDALKASRSLALEALPKQGTQKNHITFFLATANVPTSDRDVGRSCQVLTPFRIRRMLCTGGIVKSKPRFFPPRDAEGSQDGGRRRATDASKVLTHHEFSEDCFLRGNCHGLGN